MFFGVEESKEEEQQARWLDRRKRLAARRYGSLKDECLYPDTQRSLRHQQRTSAYTTQASARVWLEKWSRDIAREDSIKRNLRDTGCGVRGVPPHPPGSIVQCD